MVDGSFGDGCGRNPVTGEVGRDGRLSMSLSDEMLLVAMMLNRLVLWVLMRLI